MLHWCLTVVAFFKDRPFISRSGHKADDGIIPVDMLGSYRDIQPGAGPRIFKIQSRRFKDAAPGPVPWAAAQFKLDRARGAIHVDEVEQDVVSEAAGDRF